MYRRYFCTSSAFRPRLKYCRHLHYQWLEPALEKDRYLCYLLIPARGKTLYHVLRVGSRSVCTSSSLLKFFRPSALSVPASPAPWCSSPSYRRSAKIHGAVPRSSIPVKMEAGARLPSQKNIAMDAERCGMWDAKEEIGEQKS